MDTKFRTNIFMHRTASALLIAMLLFVALPVTPAGAVSQNITSIATGTWEATAWPTTLRSGTISVTAGNSNVVGTGTAFLTELSVGNILKTTGNIQIGTVASITSNTQLTLSNIPSTTRTNIAYNVQGVGPADNVTIANGHNVTIAANPASQTGTVTINAGGTLTVSDADTVFTSLTVHGTVNGTSGAALGVLTIHSGGVVNAGTNGSYIASSLTINSGGTMNVSRAFTVNGATSVTGGINFSSTSITARPMVFKGPVTLNAGAAWVEAVSGNGANNKYDFQHNFTNNASTFTTSDATTHTFSGAGRTISGSTHTSIARVALTGTYTNNGTLTVGTHLSGTGGLTNSAGRTLNVGGTVSIAALANAGTITKTGPGPITTALANFTNTGTLNLNGTGTITGITNNAGGTVNLNNSGAITAFNNATATSTLNIFDLNPVPHFHTLTVSAAGNTVNYAGEGDQTVKPITYSNVTFSGSGTKFITMPNGSTLANGILQIAPTGTAVASVTGPNLSVNHLFLGGSAKDPGTWGSSSSAAANQDDTFFAPTTGYLNVTNDTLLAQTITFTSTPPSNAVVGGPTYTPTATATSGLPVTFTIDSGSSAVCSISGGVVSFTAVGTCVIDADQPGNATYLATTQQQSFDVLSNQTISFTSTAPATAVVGGPSYTPSATATSGLPVTFSIDPSASAVCSINAGVVSFDAAGTCVIDADQAGNSTYHAASQVQQSFAVIESTFTDVPGDHPFWRYIEGFFDAGITSGCSASPMMFCPNAPVTRGQMAVFLEKALGNNTPNPDPTDMFSDVAANDPFKPFIEEFYNDGITSGCANNPLQYCPNQVVTRGQMAVFIEKALGNFAPTPNPTDMFSDVAANDPFKPFIEEFYNDGITSGCTANPLQYCPGQPVTRGQMAVFIAKAFNLPLP